MFTTLVMCLLPLAGSSPDTYGEPLDFGKVGRETVDLSLIELIGNSEAHDLALAVDPEPLGTTRGELAEANGEYVLVEGVFRASDHGHLSLFSGAIREVTRILLWERAEAVHEPSGPGITKQGHARTTHPSEHVSILELALDCAPLDGREVTLIGAVFLGFETQALCPTREFLEGDRLNCIWLAVDDTWTAEDLARTQEKLTPGTYVMVDGKVSCENRGFGDLYGASLHQITWIVVNATGEVVWEAGAAGDCPASDRSPESGRRADNCHAGAPAGTRGTGIEPSLQRRPRCRALEPPVQLEPPRKASFRSP